MLKADLHIHTKEDPQDGNHIKYTAKELIDKAAEEGYDVISITLHDSVFYNKELKKYAADKRILLIPGVEKTIKGKHVLLYNVTQEEADRIKTVQDLKMIRKDSLVIAAHPFFPLIGLKKRMVNSIHIFDAIEYSSFCHKLLDFNKKAVKTAKKYNKPLVGNSDLHNIAAFGKTYSLIDSKKDITSVITAIKNNDVKYISKYLDYLFFIKRSSAIIYRSVKWRIGNLLFRRPVRKAKPL